MIRPPRTKNRWNLTTQVGGSVCPMPASSFCSFSVLVCIRSQAGMFARGNTGIYGREYEVGEFWAYKVTQA